LHLCLVVLVTKPGLYGDKNFAYAQADEALGKFLDYCTYGHMIDNVVLIVTGTLHERDVQVRRLRRSL